MTITEKQSHIPVVTGTAAPSAPEEVPVATATFAPMASASASASAADYAPPEPVAATATGSVVKPKTTTTTTTTVTRTIVQPPKNLGRNPCQMNCPFCKEPTTTRVKEEIGACTIALVVLLVICFWPLFWIPLICADCKTTVHYCTKCNREIGETQPCGN